MDKPGLVTSTGPAPMSSSLFEECCRKALARGNADDPRIVEYSVPVEYVFDGNTIAEPKVFGTDSQKGN